MSVNGYGVSWRFDLGKLCCKSDMFAAFLSAILIFRSGRVRVRDSPLLDKLGLRIIEIRSRPTDKLAATKLVMIREGGGYSPGPLCISGRDWQAHFSCG
jgi:hypothetical protein